MNYHEHLAGFSIADVHRALQAVRAMTSGGALEFYNLQTSTRFVRLETKGALPESAHRLKQISADAMRVNEFYHVDLKWPSEITAGELETLHRLKELIDGVPVPITDVTTRLTKVVQLPDHQIRALLDKPVFYFPYAAHGVVHVFGTPIAPGPLEIILDRIRIQNKQAYQEFLHSAPLGTPFTLQLQAAGWAIVKAAPR